MNVDDRLSPRAAKGVEECNKQEGGQAMALQSNDRAPPETKDLLDGVHENAEASTPTQPLTMNN